MHPSTATCSQSGSATACIICGTTQSTAAETCRRTSTTLSHATCCNGTSRQLLRCGTAGKGSSTTRWLEACRWPCWVKRSCIMTVTTMWTVLAQSGWRRPMQALQRRLDCKAWDGRMRSGIVRLHAKTRICLPGFTFVFFSVI